MNGSLPLVGNFVLTSFAILLPLTLAVADESIKIDPKVSISLPKGWKVQYKGSSEPPEFQRRRQSLFEVSVDRTRLVFTASPEDAARTATLMAFSTDYVLTPPITAGERGIYGEADRFVTGILGQGFVPVSLESSQIEAKGTEKILKIVVKATGPTGEVRIFNDLVWSTGSETTTRIHYVYPENDPAGQSELTSLLTFLKNTEPASKEEEGKDKERELSTRAMPPEVENRVRSMRERHFSGGPSSEHHPGGGSSDVSRLAQEFYPSLILIEGTKGRGSGFLYQTGGSVYAATNAHVLSGNPAFKLISLQGAQISSPSASIAQGADLVRFTVSNAPKAFDLIENFEANVRIGDRVAVLGNAEGAQVVRPVEGLITGIGPDLVEVSAAFVSGNSGSPIIHLKTGKVVGVATYLVKREDKGLGERSIPSVRRFGYRLDTVKAWEPIDWQRFFIQSAEVEKIKALSEEFVKLGADANARKPLNPSNYESPALQRPLRNFQTIKMQKGNTSMSPADRKALIVRFLGDLRSASRSDIANFNSRNAYDYFKRQVEEQRDFRESLYNSLTRAMENSN